MKFFYSLKMLKLKQQNFKNLVALSLIIFGFGVCAFAQNNNGKVTGKLYDAATNETLIGVVVSVEGSKAATSTDPSGNYVLSLPAGTYTLNFRYIGYQTKQLSGVEVKKAQTTFQNIILKSASQQLKDVIVTSTVKKESQSAVYSAQKRSSAVSDGISQEAIRKTPDNNAAQVLTRVTGINIQDNRFVVVRGLGDQYNQTMVNGVQMTSTETDRNAFSFDLIPAAVIDNIVVNKTATPDMPGNFAGGVVQINTKDFPDNNFVSVSLQGGFSDQTIGKDFYSDKRTPLEFLSFGGTSRNLPKDFPLSTSRVPLPYLNNQEQYRILNNMPSNLVAVNNGSSQPNQQVQIGFGRSIVIKNNTKFGIVASLNQRKTELIEEETSASSPQFNGISSQRPSKVLTPLVGLTSYSEHKRYNYSSNFGAVLNLAYRFNKNIITFKNIYTSIFRNTYIDRSDLYPTYFDVAASFSIKAKGISYVIDQKNILNSIFAGEHKTGADNATKLDWNINFTKNSTNLPDTRNFIFRQDTVSGLYLTNGDPKSVAEALNGFSRIWSSNSDFIYGGAFNITTPLIVAKQKSLFKGGLLFQNREREVVGKILVLAPIAPVALENVLSSGNYHPNLTSIVSGLSILEEGASYSAGSSLLAAYESLENRFGEKVRVIWGVRVENYQQNVNLYTSDYTTNDNFTKPDKSINQIASRTTFNFLPSVNVVYSPVTKINIRGAFSKTAIRPELKDITSPVVQTYDLQSFSSVVGNPALKSTNITNYDLKLEFFPSAGEIFSIGAFYKQLINPIEYGQSTQDNISFRKPLNTGNAYVQGIEGEIRKKIDFVSFAPWLKNVALFGNATLLKSQVAAKKFNKTDGDGFFDFFEAHNLTGQAKYIANAGISVAAFKNSFETTLSFNKTGDYINNLGSADLNRLTDRGTYVPNEPHFIVKARNTLDLVMSQALYNRKMQIRFKASNLLKAPFIIYQDLNDNGKFDDPVTVNKTDASKQEKFNNYTSGIDNTPSYIKAQRTYTLAISYTF